MLKPDSQRKFGKMTPEARQEYERAVAEEMAAKQQKIAASRAIAKRLREERKVVAQLVSQLRAAREKAGISLNELESRTGINKSSLSRLENSVAPNPTLLTLHRYADAIGVTLNHKLVRCTRS